MSIQLKLIRLFFKLTSKLTPRFAASSGVKVFSKVRNKRIKAKELEFFTLFNRFEVPFENHKNLNCYELGNPSGKLVFLVHGWDSNIGSLTLFAKALIKTNKFRIIGFGLPAHGYHLEKRTNLVESAEAFKSVLDFLNPIDSFDVISHSFGSGVVAMSLANTNYRANRVVFLTTPNKILNIFNEFQDFVKMGSNAYSKMLGFAEDKILKEPIENYTISNKLKQASINKLMIIHDEFDKVLPFSNSNEIMLEHPEIKLHKMQRIGHYRMLWNTEVVEKVIDFVS